jgi:hypothetical protein
VPGLQANHGIVRGRTGCEVFPLALAAPKKRQLSTISATLMAETAQWLREKAEHCLQLAKANDEMAERLRILADKYFERATKLEAQEPATQPQQ